MTASMCAVPQYLTQEKIKSSRITTSQESILVLANSPVVYFNHYTLLFPSRSTNCARIPLMVP